MKFSFPVPQGAPTFTRKPQILQKTSDSGDPAIVFDIGFQVKFGWMYYDFLNIFCFFSGGSESRGDMVEPERQKDERVEPN